MDQVEFKRAKLSGWLDILGFLASLIVTAGYVLVELVKLSSLPEWLTKAWDKIHGGIENIFDGVVLERLVDLPKYPGLPFTVLFGALALLFLIMAVCSFKQGKSVLKKGGCVFAAILSLLLLAAFGLLFAEHYITGKGNVKWYLLAPCAFFFLQMILKFSAHARAY